MGKNVWHCSDPILSKTSGRQVINFRVIIREKDGSIQHNGHMMYRKKHHMYNHKKKRLYDVGLLDLI